MYLKDTRNLKQKAESFKKDFFNAFSESDRSSCNIVDTEEFVKLRKMLTEILEELFTKPICKGENEYDSTDILTMLVPILNTLKYNVNDFIPQTKVDNFLKGIIVFRELGLYKSFTNEAKDIITISPNVVTKLKEAKKEMGKVIGGFRDALKESIKNNSKGTYNFKRFRFAANVARVSFSASVENRTVKLAIVTWDVNDHSITIDITESFK